MTGAPIESHTVSSVTCLGCGCTCDDITVTVRDGRIADIERACPAGLAWFGNGVVPSAVLRGGRSAPFDDAIGEAAELLASATGQPLVYLGADLTCEAQRAALRLADLLGAVVDTATSDAAAAGLLAAQRRGRATATLGELRNRADLLVFWGVDPTAAYPRYLSRYALDPVGTHVPEGRRGRTVVAVSIGDEHGPPGADLELTLDPADEIAALSVMRAALLGHPPVSASPAMRIAAELAHRLAQARYAVLIHDAEPSGAARDPLRVEGLIALTVALNGATRAALSSLRAGGNRSGAEAVLTWQTGYPFAVDYAGGVPHYTPRDRGLARLVGAGGRIAAVLLVGSTAGLTTQAVAAMGQLPTVVIGPRASEASFAARVVIDTGIAGIHEPGTAYRMDEVPLPLRPPLPSPRTAAAALATLTDAIVVRRGRGA